MMPKGGDSWRPGGPPRRASSPGRTTSTNWVNSFDARDGNDNRDPRNDSKPQTPVAKAAPPSSNATTTFKGQDLGVLLQDLLTATLKRERASQSANKAKENLDFWKQQAHDRSQFKGYPSYVEQSDDKIRNAEKQLQDRLTDQDGANGDFEDLVQAFTNTLHTRTSSVENKQVSALEEELRRARLHLDDSSEEIGKLKNEQKEMKAAHSRLVAELKATQINASGTAETLNTQIEQLENEQTKLDKQTATISDSLAKSNSKHDTDITGLRSLLEDMEIEVSGKIEGDQVQLQRLSKHVIDMEMHLQGSTSPAEPPPGLGADVDELRTRVTEIVSDVYGEGEEGGDDFKIGLIGWSHNATTNITSLNSDIDEQATRLESIRSELKDIPASVRALLGNDFATYLTDRSKALQCQLDDENKTFAMQLAKKYDADIARLGSGLNGLAEELEVQSAAIEKHTQNPQAQHQILADKDAIDTRLDQIEMKSTKLWDEVTFLRKKVPSQSQAKPPTPPPEIDRIKPLAKKIEALQEVTRFLEERYNNLTTQEVARAMLGQLEEVFPNPQKLAAKALDVDLLTNGFMQVSQQVRSLKDNIKGLEEVAQQGKETLATKDELSSVEERYKAMLKLGDGSAKKVMSLENQKCATDEKINNIHATLEQIQNTLSEASNTYLPKAALEEFEEALKTEMERLKEELSSKGNTEGVEDDQATKWTDLEARLENAERKIREAEESIQAIDDKEVDDKNTCDARELRVDGLVKELNRKLDEMKKELNRQLERIGKLSNGKQVQSLTTSAPAANGFNIRAGAAAASSERPPSSAAHRGMESMNRPPSRDNASRITPREPDHDSNKTPSLGQYAVSETVKEPRTHRPKKRSRGTSPPHPTSPDTSSQNRTRGSLKRHKKLLPYPKSEPGSDSPTLLRPNKVDKSSSEIVDLTED